MCYAEFWTEICRFSLENNFGELSWVKNKKKNSQNLRNTPKSNPQITTLNQQPVTLNQQTANSNSQTATLNQQP